MRGVEDTSRARAGGAPRHHVGGKWVRFQAPFVPGGEACKHGLYAQAGGQQSRSVVQSARAGPGEWGAAPFWTLVHSVRQLGTLLLLLAGHTRGDPLAHARHRPSRDKPVREV